MIKNAYSGAIMTFIFSLSVFYGCTGTGTDTNNVMMDNKVTTVVEEKIFSNATLDDNFADDKVIIGFNKEASLNIVEYTPSDFPEINCIKVVDATSGTLELINAGMLDSEKFRRVLALYLAEKSKENVLQAIKLLEKRDDILFAEPDFIVSIIFPVGVDNE